MRDPVSKNQVESADEEKRWCQSLAFTRMCIYEHARAWVCKHTNTQWQKLLWALLSLVLCVVNTFLSVSSGGTDDHKTQWSHLTHPAWQPPGFFHWVENKIASCLKDCVLGAIAAVALPHPHWLCPPMSVSLVLCGLLTHFYFKILHIFINWEFHVLYFDYIHPSPNFSQIQPCLPNAPISCFFFKLNNPLTPIYAVIYSSCGVICWSVGDSLGDLPSKETDSSLTRSH